MEIKMKLIVIAMLAAQGFLAPKSAVVPTEGRDLLPPPSWAHADPADSLYQAARRALTQKDYEAAAKLFDAIVTRFPRSEYAPDALYWKGFALQSRTDNLDGAVEALEAQAKRYPQGRDAQRAVGTADPDSRVSLLSRGESRRRSSAVSSRRCRAPSEVVPTWRCRSPRSMHLQQMDSERVMPLLTKVLARRENCSTPLRKNALFILAQKSGADREKLLLNVAKSDPSPAVRSDAVFHLSQAKSDAAVDALGDLLLHADEKSVRQNALFALAQNKSDRAKTMVRTFALSSDAPMALRKDAIFHLAQDVGFLMEAYPKVTEPGAKCAATMLFHIASRLRAETEQVGS